MFLYIERLVAPERAFPRVTTDHINKAKDLFLTVTKTKINFSIHDGRQNGNLLPQFTHESKQINLDKDRNRRGKRYKYKYKHERLRRV